MHVLLISTYDMGRQPFGLASPAAWLKAAGVEVVCADLDKERLDDALVHGASLVACFLPMHTATRLAMPIIDRIRALRPDVRLAAYGLYAPLNAALLREHGVTHVLGGEFEEDLVRIALGEAVSDTGAAAAGTAIPRLAFRVPDRGGLLPLARYATLQSADGRRMVGYTEATR
ncbi:MAG: CUAEP/CCAEP-tail radical SAM protein, partial [Acidobacteriota bacterium]